MRRHRQAARHRLGDRIAAQKINVQGQDLARDQQDHGKIEGMEGMNRKEGHAAAPVRMLSTDVDSALPRIRLPVKGGAPRLPQAVV